MDTTGTPARPLTFDVKVYDFEDLVEAEGMARFHDGSHPVAEELSLRTTASLDDLRPSGLREVRRMVEDGVSYVLLDGDGVCLVVRRWDNGSARCTITGVDAERVGRVADALRATVPPVDPDDGRVEVDFVHDGGRCPVHLRRRLAGSPWEEIRSNYPASVRLAVDQLADVRAPTGEARLVLWHGPPGTGKTTAARALARAWSSWCRTVYVVDPDVLFSRPRYLVQLLLGERDGGDEGDAPEPEDGAPTWRLLLVEDADELLRSDAKEVAGQALSRLLNLGDGFLGQGLQLLILISTNERVDRLHPAVTRPGRCLANVHFGAFERAEAELWLGRDPGPGDSFTLAELFRRAGTIRQVEESARPVERVGQYL